MGRKAIRQENQNVYFKQAVGKKTHNSFRCYRKRVNKAQKILHQVSK